MKSRNIQRVFAILAALLIIILGTGAALAQGKGRGGDKNGGGEKRGGGQSAQPRGQGNKSERQQSRNENPQAQREQPRQQQRQQPRFEGPPVQRQQQQSRPQQARRPDFVRAEQRRPDLRQTPDNRGVQQRQYRVEGARGNGEGRYQRRGNGNSQTPGQQRQVPWGNAWPNNYGYERSRDVHDQNAERKAWKNEEKALRRDLRGDRSYARGYQYDPYYGDNRYVYQYPEHRRLNALRNLIANVLASNVGYNDNYYSQYQPSYYGSPYYPAYYSDNYYVAYPQYQNFAAAPYYADYQPYGYGYDPQYANVPYYGDNYANNLPFAYIGNSASGGSFMRQLISRLLALGYDQGYNDGLTARRAGYGNQYYSDPYAYEDTNYVPYSNSLGENRRCLSDGYEVGYNDALYNQRGSDPYQNGNVDLVSLLIGSGLQLL